MATVVQITRGAVGQMVRKTPGISLQIVHRPGMKHVNADPVSRHPCDHCGRIDDDQSSPTSADMGEDTTILVNGHLSCGRRTPANLRQLQLDDLSIKFV